MTMDKPADFVQVGGSHYKKVPPEFQHWNLVLVHRWDYFQAQAIKYIMRYKEKNGIQDLKKARHFVDKMIETELLTGRLEPKNETVEAPDPALVPEPVSAPVPEGQVKPTGWIGFRYEGGGLGWDRYVCEVCRAEFDAEQGANPNEFHYCPGEEPTRAYVDQ